VIVSWSFISVAVGPAKRILEYGLVSG